MGSRNTVDRLAPSSVPSTVSRRDPHSHLRPPSTDGTLDITEQRRLRFGKALAATRRNRQLSQAELGKRVGGIVQATISSWESGATVPLPEQVFALEDALGCSDDNLLSAHLGYKRLAERAGNPPPKYAIDYIEGDPRLQPWAKDVLRNVYEAIADKVSDKDDAHASEPKRRRSRG